MLNRAMNFLEFIFAVLLLMKITQYDPVSDWSWWIILLPFILNLIWKLINWVAVSLNLPTIWRREMADYYIQHKKQQFLKKELRNEKH